MGSVRRAAYIASWLDSVDESVAEAVAACNGNMLCVERLGWAFSGESIVRYEFVNGLLIVEFDERRLASNKWFRVAREAAGLGVVRLDVELSGIEGVDAVGDALASLRYAAAAYMLSWLAPVTAEEVAESAGMLLANALRAEGVERLHAGGRAELSITDQESGYAFSTSLFARVDVSGERVRLGFRLVPGEGVEGGVRVAAVFEDGGVLAVEIGGAAGPGGLFALELDVPRGADADRYAELVSRILRVAPGFALWAWRGETPDLLERLIEEYGGRIVSRVRRRARER